MSKLDDLIKNLCPDGVEFKKLGEVAEIKRGKRVVKSQLSQDGKYAVYQNSLIPLGYYENFNCSADTTFIISAGAAGEIGYSEKNFWAADDCLYFESNENFNSRFLYHLLIMNQHFIYSNVRKASVPRLSRTVIENLKIPLPPLEVQREIVRILDNFTELTAELTARKKQYEFYRDLLLTFDDGVEFKKLGEVIEQIQKISWNKSNKSYKYVDLSSVSLENRKITETTIVNPNDAPSRAQQILQTEDILFGTTRPTLKRFCMIPKDYDGQICSTGFCILRADKKFVLPLWIYFNISSSKFFNYVSKVQHGTSYPMISDLEVKNFEIPIPPIEEQERIVKILDRFDKLCNDISEGLPAEISARQKQYEGVLVNSEK